MKSRSALFVLLCFCSTLAFGAQPKGAVRGVTHSTIDVSDLRDVRIQADDDGPGERQAHRHYRRPRLERPRDESLTATEADRAVTALRGRIATDDVAPAPARSFLALPDDNTVFPPDTSGAAGPNHLMTMLNSQVRIQNKGGAVLSTVSLNSFWSATDAFDPRVVYDAGAGRWLAVAMDGTFGASSVLRLAVSRTTDPTGTWDRYTIPADQEELGNGGDFPTIGFNGDLVVINVNMFTPANQFDASEIFVIDKPALYTDREVDSIFFVQVGEFNIVPALTHGSSSVVYLAEAWDWNDGGFGSIKLFSISGTTLTELGYAVGPGWFPYGDNMGPQAATPQKIDVGDDRVQNVVYRNGSLYVAHTVFLPMNTPTRSSVQWWKLAPNLSTVQQNRIDDGSGATFYSYPSIAVNAANDVMLGFSVMAPTHFASAGYALQKASDGLMTTPYIYKGGEATYFVPAGGYNRWGDYSATSVDPVNDLEFWTIQEYAASPFDRWGTWWANVVPFGGAPTLTATAAGTTVVGTSWNAVSGAQSYEIVRSANNSSYTTLATPAGTGFDDFAVVPNTTYLYKVRGLTATGAPMPFSNLDPATTIVFTDDPQTAGTIIKRSHVVELRTAVNAFRAAAGLGPFAYADDPLPLLSLIRAQHIAQLRSALDAARSTLGLAPLSYTDGAITPGVTRAKAAHVQELRSGVK